MRFSFPDMSGYFETDIDRVNTLVIENKTLFRLLVSDIYNQINGDNGKAVLEYNSELLDFSKNAELFTTFVPFEINRKSLINKISSAIEKTALSGDHYEETMNLLSAIERYLDNITDSFYCNVSYERLNIMSLIKAAGVEIVDDYESLSEKIVDYMELVREFDTDNKIFLP